MDEILELFTKHLREKVIGLVIAALFAAIGWYWGKRRARAEWKRREFFDRLNVSLNILRDNKLLIRTILEKSCQEFFLNTAATETILAATQKTTEANSLIPLPKEDCWYFLNAVLNEVAEKFAEGQIKRDLGIPVQTERYLICLTNECSGEIKTRKLRAMLIQKKLLEKLPTDQPTLESPNHQTRWTTLQQLAASYRTEPFRFLEMEIVV